MYAVYGLTEDREHIEVFLGYVPAAFFEQFTDPSHWSIKTIEFPNGEQKIGRLCGRGFFVPAPHLRANKETLYKYMGKEACGDIDMYAS